MSGDGSNTEGVDPQPPQMLGDGSNPEGVDPHPPLNWGSKDDFKDVVLYGSMASPLCAKLRAYLIMYNIDHKMINCMTKKGSDYKKMPVLDVKGRQVNDSYIILKNMVPALTGVEAIDEQWETILSYQLAPAIEWSLSSADAVKWMSPPHGFGPPYCLLKCCLASIIMNRVVKPNIVKARKAMPDKYKEVSLGDIGTKLKTDINQKKKMFHGGEEPGPVDISFYSVCSPFYFSRCENVTSMISECGLQTWWDEMEKAIPLDKLFPPED